MASKRASAFTYNSDGELCCESVNISQLRLELEDNVHQPTPFFVYSESQIRYNVSSYQDALKSSGFQSYSLGYALKANSNLYLLNIISDLGCRAITVSGNEIKVAMAAGFDPSKIIFNGNGKQTWEVDLAIINDCLLNVDSKFDAQRIGHSARALGKSPRLLIRVNPHLDAKVHPYNSTALKDSKFGVPIEDVTDVIDNLMNCCPDALVVGFHCHIGSTVRDVKVYEDVARTLVELVEDLRVSGRGKHLQCVNIGGGLGIDYEKHVVCGLSCGDKSQQGTPWDLARAVAPVVSGKGLELILEPGRSIIGDTALLIADVIGVKSNGSRSFLVTTAAMTEIIRPSLYSAYHHITLVNPNSTDNTVEEEFDVVGPVCESGDFLGKNRSLRRPRQGSLLAVWDVGAYCFSMASNYNLRGKVAEVLVTGNIWKLIRRPETLEDLLRCYPSRCEL